MTADAHRALRELGLRPLTARSIVLSVLLGVHPAQLSARDLVGLALQFDVSESTARAALSRMVGAGDLSNRDSIYQLSERLLARQRRQDDGLQPARTPSWDGQWEVAIVTAGGRVPADRARLRTDLAELRLAELREGVWLRPANLTRPWPTNLDPLLRRLSAQPLQPPKELARTLWDLADWAERGTALLAASRRRRPPADRFVVAAAVVRHLRADPVLPSELLPPRWPADALRTFYAEYQAELLSLTRESSPRADVDASGP